MNQVQNVGTHVPCGDFIAIFRITTGSQSGGREPWVGRVMSSEEAHKKDFQNHEDVTTEVKIKQMSKYIMK